MHSSYFSCNYPLDWGLRLRQTIHSPDTVKLLHLLLLPSTSFPWKHAEQAGLAWRQQSYASQHCLLHPVCVPTPITVLKQSHQSWIWVSKSIGSSSNCDPSSTPKAETGPCWVWVSAGYIAITRWSRATRPRSSFNPHSKQNKQTKSLQPWVVQL